VTSPSTPPLASRRTLLAGIGVAALPAHALAARGGDVDLFAGGYNKEGGGGVLPLGYDADIETWRTGAAVAGAPDASFGVHGSRLGLHYVVEEGSAGMIAVFRIMAGRWERVARLSSGGADPCHLALDRTQSVLAAANYSSGSVAVFALDRNTGLPRGLGDVRPHHGAGPNHARQDHAHAHWVGFTADNRWLRAVDLGADAIFAYPFDARTGRVGAATIAYRATPGSGPRHLAVHPRLPRAYLVSELANTVTLLATGSDASMRAIATLSTLPAGFAGESGAAEIVLNAAGTRLYVSNRGHDSIAVFAIAADGMASLIEHVACGGHWPRYIRLLERQSRLLVANERSGMIATFRVAPDGRLAAHGPGVAAPGVAYIGEIA
jgi:6-phosphogluconolactonase